MLSDKLLPRFYLAPGIKRLRIPPFCRRLRFRDRATPSLPQPTEYYDFQFRKARTSVSVGVSRPKARIIIILRLLDEQKVQILSPPSLPFKTKKTSLFRFRSEVQSLYHFQPPSPLPEENTARRNRMGEQKQTKLPKNTHTTAFLPRVGEKFLM